MIKMIKKYKITLILFAVLLITGLIFLYLYNSYIIFVKYVEHGVLVNKTDLGTNYKYVFLIDGKQCSFITRDKAIDISKNVVDFKYRNGTLVKVIKFPAPLKEKIMAKKPESIDLEYSGVIKLSSKASVYKRSAGSISADNISSIIVGAGNIALYKNRKGSIKTAIVDGNFIPSSIRVGIKNEGFHSLDHEILEFSSCQGLIIQDKKSSKTMGIPAEANVTVTLSGNGILVQSDTGYEVFQNRIYILPANENNPISVLSYRRSYGFPSYMGFFEVTKSDSGLRLINEVNLEKYLYRVVPSEMPSSFGLEALKAQAVAARTYALSDLYSSRFAGEGFHVDDSTMSQVYNNIEENPLATKAINATRGLVMKYNGELIDAKYYSTSHGYGAKSGEIWSSSGVFPGTDRPYLVVGNYLINKGKFDLSSEKDAEAFFKNWNLKSYDSYSPYFRWKVTMTGEELKNTIEKNLRITYQNQKDYILTFVNNKFESKDIPENCLGVLKDIKVVKRGEGGNIMELVVSGTEVTYKIVKELNVRYVLRPRKSDTGSENDVLIKRIKGEDLKNSSLLPSAFMVIDVKKDNDGNLKSATFYGGGYGHGVGMSQYGAGYLASKGYTFDKILGIYYKNIELVKIE